MRPMAALKRRGWCHEMMREAQAGVPSRGTLQPRVRSWFLSLLVMRSHRRDY